MRFQFNECARFLQSGFDTFVLVSYQLACFSMGSMDTCWHWWIPYAMVYAIEMGEMVA